MKPRVFLSHSKQDSQFIEALANQLRAARIDVWYDEWEIPPGESIRRKIFEDGIPNCHVFFVYLTEHSIQSYWVSRELDAMTIAEAEQKNSMMAMFVSAESIRNQLSLDLKSISIPVLNSSDYINPLAKFISRVWEVYLKDVVKQVHRDYEVPLLTLEKDKLQLETTLSDLRKSDYIDFDKIEKKLESLHYGYEGNDKSLKDIFIAIRLALADGSYRHNLEVITASLWDIALDNRVTAFESIMNFNFRDIVGELILLELIHVELPSKHYQQLYYLSEFGKKYILRVL